MYAIVDIESTGGGFKGEKIIDIAVYLHDGQKIVDSYSTLVNPGMHIPSFISKLTKINDKMVADAPKFEEIAPEIIKRIESAVFVAHNVQYDYGILKQELRRTGYNFKENKLCTIKLSKEIFPGMESYSLGKLCKELGIDVNNRHRAGGDALATAKLFGYLMEKDKDTVKDFLENPYKVSSFAPNIPMQTIDVLPEETGVYYMFNEKEEVIYVGKSNFIKDRVLQHLAEEPINKDKRKLFERTHKVTYELTGSELLAMLLESYEVQRLNPKFNKRQRPKSRPYGVIKYENAQGYLCLKPKKMNPEDNPVAMFSSIRQAKTMIDNCISAYRLCPKLSGRSTAKKACGNFSMGKCDGACIGKEKSSYYNARLEEALSGPPFQYTDFLIVGEGRQYDEASVVGIFDNQFYGYGFFEKEKIKQTDYIRESLQPMRENSDANKIILSYLNRNKLDDLVVL